MQPGIHNRAVFVIEKSARNLQTFQTVYYAHNHELKHQYHANVIPGAETIDCEPKISFLLECCVEDFQRIEFQI